MSLHPLKKSDQKKAWMKGRRDKARMVQPEYHLIVTEGVETEPQYFGAVQRIINGTYRQRIQLQIEGVGDNTLNLLERARQYAENSGMVFKHVWVVYDTDDFPPEHINRTARLCAQYSKPGETLYHPIWSNQCIELWFLLHFSYFHTDLHRNQYWGKLSAYFTEIGAGTYRKNRSDLYEVLRPYLDRAIENAEKLAELNKGKQPSESAPGTQVHELMKKLKPYL